MVFSNFSSDMINTWYGLIKTWSNLSYHVVGSFNIFEVPLPGMSEKFQLFLIWGYVLHVEQVSCVITNCGEHQWVILLSLALITTMW